MSDLSVLVVEDEPTMCRLLTEMLYHVGASRVIEAATATDGLSAYQEGTFGIVMLDLGLPDGDGHDVMAEIKRTNPDQHVVLVTADDSIESIQKAITSGANGYVVKPYSREKIQDVVNNYVLTRGES